MSLFSAPLQINFVIPSGIRYDIFEHPPPIYITSSEAPAYLRLYLLSQVLKAFKDGTVRDSGYGTLICVMQIVDENWAAIERDGPPDITSVMQYLVVKHEEKASETSVAEVSESERRGLRRNEYKRLDVRSGSVIKDELIELRKSLKYKEMLKVRERLPAFKVQDIFLDLIEKSRVLVVVGETG